MKIDTRKIVVRAYGLLIELEIEESYRDEYGYPDDRIPASGEVVAARVLDIEDPAAAYAEYAMLREAR